jgi:hypothetical protein
MTAKTTALKNKKKSSKNLKSANGQAKKRGPKPSNKEPEATETIPEPGVAGSSLHNAINAAVACQTSRIANALIEGTIKGNVSSAKLLIDITGARNAPRKSANTFSLAEFLASQEEWQDPEEEAGEILPGDPRYLYGRKQ